MLRPFAWRAKGVFQGSRCQQHHEQLPALPACRGEQRGLRWVLGSHFSICGQKSPWQTHTCSHHPLAMPATLRSQSSCWQRASLPVSRYCRVLLPVCPYSSFPLTPTSPLTHEFTKKQQRFPAAQRSLPSHTNPLERYLRCSTQALGAEGTCWGLQRAQVVPHLRVVKAPHAVAALSGLAHPISAPFSGLDLCLLLRCCTWWCLASLAGGN